MESYEQELRRAYARTAGGSGKPVICLGANCKLCNLIRGIKNFKDRYDEPTVELADRMRAKEQYFSNICFDPDYGKIVLFAYGTQIMDDLAKYQLHSTSDYKDFAHPTRGRLMVIDKTIGINKRPQYGVTPKASIHQLPNIPEPYNLKKIAELLEQGIEYVPQWRLDTKSHVVRFIGYGQDQTRFFKTLLLHWGIQHSEFELVQQGAYSPFVATNVGSEDGLVGNLTPPPPEDLEEEEDVPMFNEPTQETSIEIPDSPAAPMEAVQQMIKASPSIKQSSQPPCMGKEFDPDDQECTGINGIGGCEWKEPCRTEFLQRYGG